MYTVVYLVAYKENEGYHNEQQTRELHFLSLFEMLNLLAHLDESYSFYTRSSSSCHASFVTTEVRQLQILLLGVLINLVGDEFLAFWAAVSGFFLLSLSFQTCFVQFSSRVRSHGLLVHRLCFLPDTPIIFIYLL